MHYAHAWFSGLHWHCNKQCWFNVVCCMHFLGRVISPQGSLRGCHESYRLYCTPPSTSRPPVSFSSSGQSPARQQDAADPAATPDYIHELGCQSTVWMQSGTVQFFLLSLFSRCCCFVFFLAKCSNAPSAFLRVTESLFVKCKWVLKKRLSWLILKQECQGSHDHI